MLLVVGWKLWMLTCVLVFFTHILVNYENKNKPRSAFEPEKETVLKETLITGIRQVFIDL